MTLRQLCVPLVFSAALVAQTNTTPPRGPQFTELKAYLGLTDDQITNLENLRRTQFQSQQSIFQQIQAKETSLQQALAATPPNPATIGQLMLDIRALRQQIQQAEQSLVQQEVATLTADQQSKLQALAQAQKLEPDINQAVRLGLLAPLNPSGVRGFGFGGPGAGPMMMGRFGGRNMRP